jgi:hypothetical protein
MSGPRAHGRVVLRRQLALGGAVEREPVRALGLRELGEHAVEDLLREEVVDDDVRVRAGRRVLLALALGERRELLAVELEGLGRGCGGGADLRLLGGPRAGRRA